MMALLQASYFVNYIAAWSVPVQDGIQVFTGAVDLVLSTGVIQKSFDRVSTTLTCIHCIDTNNLYSLSPNEYITIINLRSKLLILEIIIILIRK